MAQFLDELFHAEALGDPDSGIAPVTRWEDVSDDWYCLDCGEPKSSFVLVEV